MDEPGADELARLETIVDEVEAVFKRHGIAGIAAVSTEDVSAFGMYLPPGPVEIAGRNNVRLPSGPDVLNPKNETFYRAMEGLLMSAQQAAASFESIWNAALGALRRAKFAEAKAPKIQKHLH